MLLPFFLIRRVPLLEQYTDREAENQQNWGELRHSLPVCYHLSENNEIQHGRVTDVEKQKRTLEDIGCYIHDCPSYYRLFDTDRVVVHRMKTLSDGRKSNSREVF